jgi:hypothetical protein
MGRPKVDILAVERLHFVAEDEQEWAASSEVC